jgi:hypothetical protein
LDACARRARKTPPFLGTTFCGGAFLLLHEARQLYAAAQRCLGALGAGNAGRLVLSLYFKAILGIQRNFISRLSRIAALRS